jgi:protein-S-isoprenylcysteine O-methyltransferase Ste14
MVKLGNFFFHYRNGLFPLVYALLVIKSPGLFPDYRVALLVGFLVALAGQLLRAITIGLEYIIRGGRNRQVYAEKLVTGGIFSHCRNPLYVGNVTIIIGVGIASNSLLFMCTAVPFFLVAYRAIVAAEENFLRNKFGKEFDDYCARVNRFLPNLSGISQTVSGMYFNWRRLITAEYGSTFVWLLAIILVTFKNVWLHGEYGSATLLVSTLWIALGVVVAAYAAARYLKKSGRLNDEIVPPRTSAGSQNVSA